MVTLFTRQLAALAIGSALAAGINDGTAPAVAADCDLRPASRCIIEIHVLSGRADLVTGGNALIEIKLPEGVLPETLTLDLNGANVTDSVRQRSDGRLLGLINGMRQGTNRLTARAQGARAAALKVTSYPLSGPVFAGAQVKPWLCQNEEYGLSTPEDAACSAPAIRTYFYKDALAGRFLPYDPAAPPPATSVAMTTTDQGNTLPYVVRRERGTMDRGIYDIAILHEPEAGWNHKVLFKFEGNTRPGHQQGGGPNAINRGGPANVLDDQALALGFAVASSSLMRNGTNANDKVAAEALMMLKEHIVEAYGEIRYTIGAGCSGGAVQQHAIAANYPGLLNGIQPMCSFPDAWSTMTEVVDCDLLARYFAANAVLWPDPIQRAAVTGHIAPSTCQAWHAVGFAKTLFDPAVGCLFDNSSPSWVYHPVSNPGGTRCTLQDYERAIFGTAQGTGFARRPWDNAGVQYGLQALHEGKISPEQFVHLNENTGGMDIEFGHTAGRTEADPLALQVAYRTGEVVSGRELAKVPIMDLRGTDNATLHEDVFTYVTRARLTSANGHAGNQVAWTSPNPVLPDPAIPAASFDLIDRWLAAIQADSSTDSLEAKVIKHKPAAAIDSCWSAGQMGKCGTSLPYYATTRMAAGGPLTNDILKCQLKPLSRSDYTIVFTEHQWARLQSTFPHGVCDWSKPGAGQMSSIAWLTYAGGPGGQSLGPPPRSHPVA